MKFLLLANPVAAGRRTQRWLPRLREFFKQHSPGFDYAEAPSPEELRQRAQEAAAAGYDCVLAAGGDGTAHAVLNALRGTGTALGVLPLGHGNDLARALGVPLEPLAAAEFLLHARVSSIDVARVGEQVFGCVAGVGFDAEANRRANSWGGWPTGHRRYLLAALATLASYRPLRMELVSDTEDFAGEAMLVAVANGSTYGGGLRIAPEAVVDDGLLDVCIIERMSRFALLQLYTAARRGRHLHAPCVRYFKTTRVEFRGPVGATLFGDGEFLARLPLEIRIEPAALRVLRRRG